MTNWTDMLIEEHELLERALTAIELELKELSHAGGNLKKIKRSLDFLFEIGDKVHNQKEEKFLFPKMGEHGVPQDGGPIGVMLYEHQTERDKLQKLLSKIQESGQIDDESLALMQEYFSVRKEHIWKENDVLYPMAHRILPPEEHDKIYQEMVEWDQTVYGANARQKYQEMVAEIEKMGQKEPLLVKNLSYEQIDAIMEALPFEVTFVQDDDTVAYFNRMDKEKIFVRTRSVIGRKVEKCHPEKSVDKVLEIVEGFKNNTLEYAEFWIGFKGSKVYIQYFPVYDRQGRYMGVLEITMDIGHIQSLTGEKRLL